MAVRQELTHLHAPNKEARRNLVKQKRRRIRTIQMGRTPKSGQPISFKPTEAMRAFFEAMSEAEDISMSELARRSADLFRDLYERLENDWPEIERRARTNGQPIGAVLASFVRAWLEQDRKSRK